MIYHNILQNTDMWYELRLGKATASKFGVFMAHADKKTFGEPAKAYALQLALERITGRKAEYSFSNDHMLRGIEQESIARYLYEQENFVDVSNGGFFDFGDYGDSPDGLVGDNGVIEIKSVIATTHYATLTRDSFDPAYKWQVIGHLDCTGRDWVDFVSYCSDFPDDKQLLTYRVYREHVESEISMLRERRAEFLELVNKITEEIN